MAPKTNLHLYSSDSKNTAPRPSALIVRLPLFRDGVFIGNKFIAISPRLRAKIGQMTLGVGHEPARSNQ
jgi:hypothetical protein